MPDSLSALEADRSKLLQQFLGLGDLRPGSITATIRRCGKPTCHCAKPNDPGHDPQTPADAPRVRQNCHGNLPAKFARSVRPIPHY